MIISKDDDERNIDPSNTRNTIVLLKCSATKGPFLDVSIQVLGKQLQLHKTVLLGNPYFKALLTIEWKDSKTDVVEISPDDPLMTGQIFAGIVHTAHNRPVQLTSDNVKGILANASFLQMENICLECVNFCIPRLS